MLDRHRPLRIPSKPSTTVRCSLDDRSLLARCSLASQRCGSRGARNFTPACSRGCVPAPSRPKSTDEYAHPLLGLRRRPRMDGQRMAVRVPNPWCMPSSLSSVRKARATAGTLERQDAPVGCHALVDRMLDNMSMNDGVKARAVSQHPSMPPVGVRFLQRHSVDRQRPSASRARLTCRFLAFFRLPACPRPSHSLPIW